MPFKKDESTNEHQVVSHIPSVQDSSTGQRHSMDLLGNLVGTHQQGMDVADSKLIALETKTPKISKSVAAAEGQLKQAQDMFKTMQEEQVRFQQKQAEEMGAIQALFEKGFAQIDLAKSIADEVGEGSDSVEQIDN